MGLNNKCPDCQSTNIHVVDGPYFNDEGSRREMHCMDCGLYWKEVYHVTLTLIEKESRNG